MLELTNIKKTYHGGKTALDGVSLTLGPGQIIGLFGENGAGKTTLMKCILNFLKYQGEIIDVKLYKAQDGSKQYQGKLLGLENGVLSIEEEKGNVVTFEYKDVASVRLAVIF